MIGNPGRELEVDGNEFAGALEWLYSDPMFRHISSVSSRGRFLQ
jgi:hypothetical protein